MKQRWAQIFAGVLIGIALFVSSASACVCPHHEQEPEKKSISCHEHTDETPSQAESAGTLPVLSEGDCYCIQPSPRAISKSEKIRFDGKTLPASRLSLPKPVYSATNFFISETLPKPEYLSDSFYNLPPGRAPPSA